MDLALLKALSETPGAPGHEKPIRDYVKAHLASIGMETSTDAMGNLTCVVKSKNKEAKKLMLAAHLDEISFMVTHIDDNGFLRLQPLGGFDPKTLTSMRVLVHGKKTLKGVMGCKPIHIMSAEERNKAPKLKDYFVDTGFPAEEVKKQVEVGTTVTRQQDLQELGECISGKSLDNRLSVYILLKVLEKLKKPSVDVHAVFTVQEEVGLRGATGCCSPCRA